MILEQRIYTVLPHRLRDWLELWQTKALPIQKEHLPPGAAFLGMYFTEVGPLNEMVHLWQHVDFAGRGQMRKGVETDPRWAEYLAGVEQLAPIVAMRNVILRPTAFSPSALKGVE